MRSNVLNCESVTAKLNNYRNCKMEAQVPSALCQLRCSLCDILVGEKPPLPNLPCCCLPVGYRQPHGFALAVHHPLQQATDGVVEGTAIYSPPRWQKLPFSPEKSLG